MGLRGYCTGDLIRDACPSRPRAENYHPYLRDVDLADVQGCHDGGQSYTSGSLDIVIEAGDMWTIFVQKPPGIMQAKVFTKLLSDCTSSAERIGK